MLVGIVGSPNKGKSTMFSALTMIDVHIADYPFTTIKPNVGTTYITKECVHNSLSVKCTPRNSECVGGVRRIPVEIIDVAGLVAGAHEGRGMGNQFLGDISSADALILVADGSGHTDSSGNPCQGCNPVEDVRVVVDEISEWLAGIITKHMGAISRSKNAAEALVGILTGMRIGMADIEHCISECNLTSSNANWNENDVRKFSKALLKRAKPFMIAANKSDIPGFYNKVKLLYKEFGEERVVPCSAAVELALRKAERQGIIEYNGNPEQIRIIKKEITHAQEYAINYMVGFAREHGTGVQQIINKIYFDILDNIVVYPVEDEGKYTDHFGNVLPDAILIKRGSTALDLAAKIHTDLGERMLYAVDARTKKRLAKGYVLNDNDVIKVVSAAKPK
jgi:ribosome-binding ATPase YchF (GTP1/OBG family)